MEANGEVSQEENPAAASASQGECVAPAIAPEDTIVVSRREQSVHPCFTTGKCGFANSPDLSQQPRPELLAKKLFPNRKTLLSGKKSSPTAQNPRTDGKVRLLA
jgi:hypothetical protein